MLLGETASVKKEFCGQYPDELKDSYCGWATGVYTDGVTFTIAGERKMNYYPELYAGEEYTIST